MANKKIIECRRDTGVNPHFANQLLRASEIEMCYCKHLMSFATGHSRMSEEIKGTTTHRQLISLYLTRGQNTALWSTRP